MPITTSVGTPDPSDIDTIDEVAVREREALPADAVVIVADGCTVAPPPSSDVWGLQIVAADIAVEGGGLALFAALPLGAQPDPHRYDGDVVVQLRTEATTPADQQSFINVDVLIAREGTWKRVETWTGTDAGWPHRIAPAVTRLMRYVGPILEPLAPPAVGGRFGVLRDMVSAGLLHEGEKLVCLRPGAGTHYEAHVVDGGIQLPDGRWFARPSGALTALGYKHQNGWNYWSRARDGVPLADLRVTPSPPTRRTQRRKPQLRGMLADGTLRAGDELHFVQPRKGIVHRACVLADGRLQLADGRICATPSAALTACHGSMTAGWQAWRRVSDNRTLDELREEHRNRDTRSHTQQQAHRPQLHSAAAGVLRVQRPSEPCPSDESGHELPSTPSAT